MARAHIYFFGAGATLALATLLLFERPGANLPGLIATVAIGYAIAAVVLTGFDRLPDWAYRAIQTTGTLLISFGVYFSGSAGSAFALFYVWVGLYAGHFFSRWWTALQITFVAVAYGVVLLVTPEPGVGFENWLVVVGTVIVVAAMVTALKARLDGLIEHLDEAARTDALTGLLNRRGFESSFEVQLERARRNGTGVSLVLGDLDGFKAVNDRLGHGAGDAALQTVSAVIEETKRVVDVSGRIGGEEFAIVAPDATGDDAYHLAERLRAAIGAAFADRPVPLTICFGISTFPAHGPTSDALLSAADEALYAAKAGGRDRSVIYAEHGSAVE
jgi:diguanylate cyclase (GGDEF)-like protein